MKLSKNFKRKEMLKILFSGICLGVSVLCFADVHEAPILKNNLEQVRTRGISIVPLPKRIEFAAPVYPEKVVISGSEKQPFFKIICEELKSRFEELKSPVKVQVSDKPEAGAYNIMIKDTFTFVCFAVVPFNVVKGIVISIITMLVYKHISPLLHR